MYTKQSVNGAVLKAFSLRGFNDEVIEEVFEVSNLLFNQVAQPKSVVDVCDFTNRISNHIGLDPDKTRSINRIMMFLLQGPGIGEQEEYYDRCKVLFTMPKGYKRSTEPYGEKRRIY